MTTANPATGVTARTPRLPRRLLTDSGYVLLGLPLAVASLVVLLVGLALGLGLLVLVVGLPVLTGTLYAARGLADIERLRLAAVRRQPRIRPRYRLPEAGATAWRRIFLPMRDIQSWLDLAHGIFRLPVAIVTFVLTITWWAVALTGTLYGAYDWAIPHPPENVELNELLGLGDTTRARVGLHTAIGLFFLLTLPMVVRGCALVQAGFGRAMLTGVAEMRDRITVLEEQKRAAVSAEASALRRLERDIHDGPQQRLVRLAMDLGRARQQLANDPEAAGRTLDEALDQTRETLAELRGLSRGIAPPILVDRGLPGALAALAGRGLIPIELRVDPDLGTPDGRPEAAVEHAAYFVVAEALTNVAKHARASECRVTVGWRDGHLEISVVDDGQGGAHLAKGHGLAGIADRVRAGGGVLEVTSPVGGPTEIRALLPG
ncbi:sensor histidine kinase [Micromonospora sp. NPDC050187]|uniref:sensor histidine kinase n=1 Tax=Micromonospora sp. NPDC050187 TaxID=3364277 RepID=UPI00379D7A2C